MENVDYSASALALNLHSFPHIDMTFQNVNSTFDPEYYRYREAIMFWGIVPIVWMFVTMLVVVMYFCYRCCQRDVKKAGPCLKWTIAILALLSTGAVGAGFYGNEETHKGLQHFIDASKGVQKTTTQTMHQIASMRDRLNLTVINGIEGLRMIIPQTNNQRKEIKENLDQAKVRVKSIISNILEIDRKTNRINSTQFAQYYAEEYGFYRWLAMVLLLSWMMVLFVILLFAVGKGSKYLMLVFGILSIISLILCWLCAGFHLAISVGLADFCTAPLAYMEQLSEDKTYKEIIKYYVKCDHKLNGNPFKMAIPSTYDNANLANISIHSAIVALTKIVSVAKEKDLIKNKSQEVFNAMDDTVQKLMHLNALVECTNLHKDYIDGISGICHKGLEGIVFLLVSIVLTGVNFTGVVLLTSGSWRSFTSGRDKNVLKPFSTGASEDDGPFMVTPDGGPGVSPSYYRTGAKSLRRASDILFRSFLPGCRPNLLADPSQFKKHVIATPLLENNLSPPGYSNDGNSIGGGGGGGSNRMRLAEDNL